MLKGTLRADACGACISARIADWSRGETTSSPRPHRRSDVRAPLGLLVLPLPSCLSPL